MDAAESAYTCCAENIDCHAKRAGVSDTGVDTDSCFFHDNNVTLPNCSGYGYVAAPGCINPQHRKIVTYVSPRAPVGRRPTTSQAVQGEAAASRGQSAPPRGLGAACRRRCSLPPIRPKSPWR